MLRRLLIVLVIFGCVDNTEPADDTESGGKADDMTADPCLDVCTGIKRDHELEARGDYASDAAARWATCFSCRCKSALTVLPRPEDLQCSTAAGPLTRWRPTRNGEGRIVGIETIDANGTDTTGCLNPGMAAAGCDLQSRFR